MATDLTAEIKKVYEAGQAEITKLQEQIDQKKEQIKGARAYLLAIGAIEIPVVKRRGRKAKAVEQTEQPT